MKLIVLTRHYLGIKKCCTLIPEDSLLHSKIQGIALQSTVYNQSSLVIHLANFKITP